MQKHLLYINLFAITSALALAACADEVENAVTPDMPEVGEKTPIELSVGGVDASTEEIATRASVITDEVSTLTFSNFDLSAKVFMVMKSEYVSLPTDFTNLNYGGSHDAKYCVTRGEVAANQDKMVFDTGNERYWDDAHARSTRLSIWAFTAPGATYNNCTFGASDAIQGWKTTAISPVINTWKVSKTGGEQTADDFKTQNLCFSNNIVDYTSESKTDRRLGFNTTTTPKAFEGGKLVFYHAMSRITIHIRKGQGYTSTDPFAFADGTNIKLSNYNILGTFDIADGKFSSTTAGDVPKISATTTATGDAYTLQALVIPGTTHSADDKGSIWHKNNTSISMSFTIDKNLYNVTQDALITALRENSANNGIAADATTVEMEAGKHYIFTFTIGKKQIDNITAQVADWETVEASEFSPSNARITLNVEERTEHLTKQLGNGDAFSLYMAKDDNSGTISDDYAAYNWSSGYTTKVTPSYVSGGNPHWTTNLFWDSNLNFYHFRALCEANGTGNTSTIANDLSSSDPQYLSLNHGETYNDICWGAPMLDVSNGNETDDASTLNWTYDPETYGFDGKKAATSHQIYKAIGPTKDPVKLILFHMMSDVTFNVYTTTGDDKVDLGTGTGTKVTSIELQKIYTQGNLYLGNGLVKGSQTEKVNYSFTAKPAPDNTTNIITWGNYGAIPQALEGVVLVITTADHNQYKVKLGDPEHPITATVTNKNLVNPYTQASGSDKYQINAWYPGFKYTYNFKLTKTGITDLTATVVDWENVEADEETVVIE